MAKTDAAGKKSIGSLFSNELKYMEMSYDVAASDSLTFDDQIVIGVTTAPIVIHESNAYVETAVESLGAATLKVGDTDTSDSFLTATAKASLLINTVHNETTGQGKYLATAKEIIVVPLVADLTAGKITLKITYSNG